MYMFGGCFCRHTCICVLVGTPKLIFIVFSVGSPLYALRHSLLLNLGIHQCSRDSDCLSGARTINDGHASSTFMSQLGTRASFFMLVQLVLYLQNNLLTPKRNIVLKGICHVTSHILSAAVLPLLF